MPPTNRQPEARSFNRRNSLIEGPNKYDGVISEKTGWTGDSGHTYAAAATRNGRTLVAVLLKSPDAAGRWEDAAALFDYGFNEFKTVGYSAAEFTQEEYIAEDADGAKINMRLIPDGDFTSFILKSLDKEDIEIKYMFAGGADGKMEAKAVFSVKPELSASMFAELGEVNLQIFFNDPGQPASSIASGRQSEIDDKTEDNATAFSRITSVLSFVLQIIGGVAIVFSVLYGRYRYNIMQKRKRRRRRRIIL
jgi:D-alanyl-D-alanine carboxypeptidase